MKYTTTNKGFTIIELVVVITILGVIVGLSLPNYSGFFEKSRSGEGIQILGSLLNAQRIYEFEHGNYATALSDLDVEIASANHFNAPTVADNPNAVATIVRGTGATYTLSIDEDGSIACVGSDCGIIDCGSGTCN